MTKIEWTEKVWNPTTGCTKISDGCDHCYAARMAARLHGRGVHEYRNNFDLTLQPERLEQPLKWKKPRIVFVNSMSDLFHSKVPTDYLREVFDVMRRAEIHTFQILTKRSRRLQVLADQLEWPPNVWLGVSVENHEHLDRVDHLRQVPAAVRFLSCEPLLGPLVRLGQKDTLNTTGIHWEIERFFCELTYLWPAGQPGILAVYNNNSRAVALPGPDDVLPVLQDAATWLVANRGWSRINDLVIAPPEVARG